jgi:RNA polymerase sigma factor for flagellar operon FliA
MRNRAAPAAALTDESMRQLWVQFRETRAPALRVRLIECYLPLAHVAAAKFFRQRSSNAVSFSDYLQYARLGLVEAIDGFDPSREASFETYSSYRIRGAMLNGLARESETSAQRIFWRTRQEERTDTLGPAAHSGESDLDELAGLMASLQDPLTPGWSHGDVVDETPHANPYAAAELAQLREAVDRLPGRERTLIRRHYFDHCEFRLIAQELAVSPGRVSQLHAQALVRIRSFLEEPATSDGLPLPRI